MLIRGNARNLRRVDDAKTLEQRALSVIRSLGGDAIYVQNGFPRLWTDSAGTTPVTAVGDAVGRVVGRIGTITATQSTAASKPLVSAPAAGRLAMSFDGVNDSLTTGITTGNQGWVCAGTLFTGPSNSNETVANSGAASSGGTTKGFWFFRFGSTGENIMAFRVRSGSTLGDLAEVQINATATPLRNNNRVVEGGWNTSTLFVGVDGAINSSARTGDASPSGTVMKFGGFEGIGSLMAGQMSAIVYTPVLPSLSQRQLIRRWVASLQGQTL